MAPTLIQAKDPVKNLEQQLNNELGAGHSSPSWSSIASCLEKVRAQCASALLEDVEAAKAKGIDDERLWVAHRSVNDRFRVEYTQKPKSKPVERRKLDSEYLRYIKASQKFYRGYIYRLSKAYGGIRELEEVAERVEKGHSGEQVTAGRASEAVRERVLRSCYTSLSQLGDLSRYRETQLPSKDKGPDWSHAIGYYELAQAVLPRSGHAQNQMAVVAIADNNNFRSVYHLYLSLQAMEPHPHAFANLKKALYKVRSLRENGRLFQESGPGRSPSHVLRAWYLQVISNCFHGKNAPQLEQLEKEYLQHLESFLASGLKDATLYKITFINIAAGHHARQMFEREGGSEDRMNSFLQFLRLNAKTLSVILEALHRELKATEAAKIKPSMHKLLPCVRVYSIWLVENARIIAGADQSDTSDLQQRFWTAYASCLTLLASTFPSAAQTPELCHLLAEDVDTLGFAPLHSKNTEEVWLDGKGKPKPAKPRQRRGSSASATEEEAEDMTRVQFILRTGLQLAVRSEDIPLSFDAQEARFLYSNTSSGHSQPAGPGNTLQPSISLDNVTARGAPASAAIDDDVLAARMVDDLVNDDSTSNSVGPDRALSPTRSRRAQNTPEMMMRGGPALAERRSRASMMQSPPRGAASRPASQSQSPVANPSSMSRAQARVNATPMASPSTSSFARGQAAMHTRVNSNDSNVSRGSIWAADRPGSLRSPLGNGTFGLVGDEDAIDDSGVGSSTLAGGGVWKATTTPMHVQHIWTRPSSGEAMSSPSTAAAQWGPAAGVRGGYNPVT